MAIEFQDSEDKGASDPVNNVEAIRVVNLDGNIYAIVGGDDSTLGVYAIDNDPASPTYGELSDTPVDTIADGGALHLDKIKAMDTIEVDGTTFVIAGGNDSGISTFSIDSAGQLATTDNVADDATLLLNNTRAIGTANVDDGAGGEKAFVLAAGDQDGISVFEIDSGGNLTNTDNVSDDGTTRLMNVKALDTIRVDDGAGGSNTFVIAGGDDEGGLSVFEVDSSGNLTNTDNVADSGAMRIQTVMAIETFSIDGTDYVAAAGDDGGISFFEIDSSGNLTNVGNVADDATLNLKTIADMFVGDHEGVPTLWAAATDSGLDAFEINVDPGTGEITLARVATFDSGTFDTANMRAIDGGSGFVVGADQANDSLSSFTAPCFAPGTLILTEHGERPVEALRVGDLVMTADRGPQPIRWIGIRHLAFDCEAVEKQKPIEIKAGALGNGLPRRALVVSPQHRMLFSGETVERLFGKREVIGLAKGLVERWYIRRMNGKQDITYHALLFDRHEIIFAEGTPTESFRPGPYIMSLFSQAQREEIYGIYPALRDAPEAGLGEAARPILKRREVEALVAAGPAALVGEVLAVPLPSAESASDYPLWDEDLADEVLEAAGAEPGGKVIAFRARATREAG